MDLGWGAVALFFFVLSIYYIYRIVQAVKGNGDGKRVPCVQSPQLQAIVTNQTLQLKALDRVEDDGADLKQNMATQTQLMAQMARVLEKISECAVRQEARSGK
jgi:hypothetical protein